MARNGARSVRTSDPLTKPSAPCPPPRARLPYRMCWDRYSLFAMRMQGKKPGLLKIPERLKRLPALPAFVELVVAVSAGCLTDSSRLYGVAVTCLLTAFQSEFRRES